MNYPSLLKKSISTFDSLFEKKNEYCDFKIEASTYFLKIESLTENVVISMIDRIDNPRYKVFICELDGYNTLSDSKLIKAVLIHVLTLIQIDIASFKKIFFSDLCSIKKNDSISLVTNKDSLYLNSEFAMFENMKFNDSLIPSVNTDRNLQSNGDILLSDIDLINDFPFVLYPDSIENHLYYKNIDDLKIGQKITTFNCSELVVVDIHNFTNGLKCAMLLPNYQIVNDNYLFTEIDFEYSPVYLSNNTDNNNFYAIETSVIQDKTPFSESIEQKNIMSFLTHSDVIMIPKFQRKFSWRVDNFDELFDDIFNHITQRGVNSTYDLGTILVSRKQGFNSKDRLIESLIDGQQRILTFSMLLKAVADWTDNDTFSDRLQHNMLNSYSFDGQQRISSKIISHDEKDLYIESAYRYFIKKLESIDIPHDVFCMYLSHKVQISVNTLHFNDSVTVDDSYKYCLERFININSKGIRMIDEEIKNAEEYLLTFD